jgi:hypothetical protein
MNKSNLIEHLKSQETWSIEEVLELLCGPSNPSAIIRGESHQPMGELLETAANQGRFGMLTTGIDKFYWDIELLQGGLYPDEPLDTITEFAAHHLRFIDWIKDEGVLDKIQLDSARKEEILDLIETLNEKRPEVKPAAHVIDYQRLLEEDFWTLTDLRIVLFGETHSSRYNPYHYRIYNSNLEALMQRVDIVIRNAAILEKRLKVRFIKNLPPLIDTIDEDKQEQHMWDLGYFGIYDTDENDYRSHRYYHAPDLFQVLANKQFPAPHGLIQSLEENQHTQSIELLKTLKENMLHLSDHGENPPQLVQEEKYEEDSKEEVKDVSENKGDYFLKDGDSWFVSINGEQASNLKHMIGMTYIRALFNKYDPQDSDKGIHVIALKRLIKKPPHIPKYNQLEWGKSTNDRSAFTADVEGEFGRKTEIKGMQNNYGCDGAEPVITQDQLQVIKAKIKSLYVELNETIRIADKESEEQISGEIEYLEAYVKSNTFLGKIKPATELEIENARSSVQKAITAAIKNITKTNSALGKYLVKHIECGQICTYRHIYPLRIVKP